MQIDITAAEAKRWLAWEAKERARVMERKDEIVRDALLVTLDSLRAKLKTVAGVPHE